jgi:hypothetical protein
MIESTTNCHFRKDDTIKVSGMFNDAGLSISIEVAGEARWLDSSSTYGGGVTLFVTQSQAEAISKQIYALLYPEMPTPVPDSAQTGAGGVEWNSQFRTHRGHSESQTAKAIVEGAIK